MLKEVSYAIVLLVLVPRSRINPYTNCACLQTGILGGHSQTIANGASSRLGHINKRLVKRRGGQRRTVTPRSGPKGGGQDKLTQVPKAGHDFTKSITVCVFLLVMTL